MSGVDKSNSTQPSTSIVGKFPDPSPLMVSGSDSMLLLARFGDRMAPRSSLKSATVAAGH